MKERTGMLPGFGDGNGSTAKSPSIKRPRKRPKRHGFDESGEQRGPKGGILRRGKGKGRRFEDLTGLQFGHWKVIEFAQCMDNRSHAAMWLCECRCGTRKIRAGRELRHEGTLGCRKCKAERQRRFSYRAYWKRLKVGAINRGLGFSIDFDKTVGLLRQQNYLCALSGVAIDMALSNRGMTRGEATASLDRIDNRHGYVEGNVWWVHKDLNRMKGTFSLDRFIDLCRCVATKNQVDVCQQSEE